MHFRLSLFFNVVSLLPALGNGAALVNTDTGQTRTDTIEGATSLSAGGKRRIRREEGGHLGTEIDQSGRLHLATLHEDSSVKASTSDGHEHDGQVGHTLAPKKKGSAPMPEAPKTLTPTQIKLADGLHMVGLVSCIILLAVVFSLHWKSLKRKQNLSRGIGSMEDDAAVAHSSTEPPLPPSTQADGAEDRETQKAGETLELSNAVAWKGLIFLVVLFGAIGCTRIIVCDVIKLQCDRRYTIQLFFRQDFHKVVLDMVFLFLVGRLANESSLSIDSWAFAAVVLVSALVPSWLNELSFMHHSISMYQMACSWTAMTWVLSSAIFAIILCIGAVHLHHFIFSSNERVRAMAEMVVIICVFVLPRAFESGYHMHHWYTMWLLALGCRLPNLWSRGVQAFLIGGYVNGIAVYGRDPVLACEAAFDLAYSEQCKFLTLCTWNTTAGPMPPVFMPPDWRTCSAGDYK